MFLEHLESTCAHSLLWEERHQWPWAASQKRHSLGLRKVLDTQGIRLHGGNSRGVGGEGVSLIPKKPIPTLVPMLRVQAPVHFDPQTQASWKLSPVVSELSPPERTVIGALGQLHRHILT